VFDGPNELDVNATGGQRRFPISRGRADSARNDLRSCSFFVLCRRRVRRVRSRTSGRGAPQEQRVGHIRRVRAGRREIRRSHRRRVRQIAEASDVGGRVRAQAVQAKEKADGRRAEISEQEARRLAGAGPG